MSLAILAGAPHAAFASSTVPLFTIAKSQNKNLVAYAIRVDDHCVPDGNAPVFAYWRMLEDGPSRTAPLLPREQAPYGLASQVVTARAGNGGRARIVLRALPNRPIDIETQRGADGACLAVPTATISGAPARLFNVYVRLWLFGVRYILIRGWSMDGSHVVTEKLKR
jgi:hypothetical protein